MLPFLMFTLSFEGFRVRQLLPTSQPLRETSVHSASLRYHFCSSFNSAPSTVNLSSLCPFTATLADASQHTENKTTLSLAFATLTRLVNHKSFACHSYKKHPGWGIHPRAFSPIFRLLGAIPFRIRTYEKTTRNPFRMRTSKTQHLKLFRMNTYRKTGEGVPLMAVHTTQSPCPLLFPGPCQYTLRRDRGLKVTLKKTILLLVSSAILLASAAVMASPAGDGIKTVDVPGGGHIMYGPLPGQLTPQAAIGKVLHVVSQHCGDRPQITNILKAGNGDILAAIFNVTAKNQDGHKLTGMVIASAPKSGQAAAVLLYDDSDRFPTSLNPMFKRLQQEITASPTALGPPSSPSSWHFGIKLGFLASRSHRSCGSSSDLQNPGWHRLDRTSCRLECHFCAESRYSRQGS